MIRTAQVQRTTNETSIEISLNLDGSGQAKVDTGVGFLDHMLEQLALHGLFDINLTAHGDLHIDTHHLVEDTAINLGKAFNDALGDRSGIYRMGHAYVPMDEALALAVIDFSGRPYWIIDIPWNSLLIGELPTSLLTHFFESFAANALCNLHLHLIHGRDDHHAAEAAFKALARASRQAVALDPLRQGKIASTKGSLRS
jgi:imidazoleglycerol-phosphate dehydratase